MMSSRDQSNTTVTIDLEKSCSEYYQNNTGFIIKDYEGIPENLLINIIVFSALLVLFTFLRYIGGYGRFGLIKNDEEKYTSTDYQNKLKKSSVSINNIFEDSKQDEPTSSQPVSCDPETFNESSEGNTSQIETSQDSSKDSILVAKQSTDSLTQESGRHSDKYPNKYFFSWLFHMWKLKDVHIKEKSGKDALYYLIFQRYLILYLFIITCLSLSILLPINILNEYIDAKDKAFSQTTISNVDPNSPVLWVHLILSWIFLVLGFALVKIFSWKMKYDEGEYVSRTVLITNYPIEHCEVETVKLHLNEAYPSLIVNDIQFAYDIRKLGKLTKIKRTMECGRIISQKIYNQTGERPTMYSFHFGSVFELCCCCCNRFLNKKNKIVDSIDFYTKRENDLIVKITEYKEKVLKQPLGILFVTFESQEMAAKFLKDYHLGFISSCLRKKFNDKGRCLNCYLCKNLVKISSVSKQLKSDRWNVRYATSPNNIIWENVAKYGFSWWLRVFLINTVLVIVMIFFTTPSILLDKISSVGTLSDMSKELQKIIPEFLVEFLPSLILRLLAALLPVLVAWTALAELHWTRSSRNRSMMVKTYCLLLFMTLILPTLGLTSINLLFQWFNDSQNIKWRCVSDNGAFFIKYVTTFSWIGTALDLLRLPDLFLYLLKIVWARSAIERHDVRQQVALEFNYGVEYAWILSMFTITLSFSVVCPLITPFGLLYMIIKHLVDRYNLYFGYIPTKVDKRIHKTAVTIAIGSFIILQFCILFFIAIRNKANVNSNSMMTVQVLIITIACCLFISRLFFGFFKRLSPFHKHSGSSCQASQDINNTENIQEIDTETYNRIKLTADEEEENGSVHTDQPVPTCKSPKKKRLNIFKRKQNGKSKGYEIFQSPFIPSILRHVSSDYMNIVPESRVNSKSFKFKNLQDQHETVAVDQETPIPSYKLNNESNRCDSVVGDSQIELILNTSLDSNNFKKNTDQAASPTTVNSPQMASGTGNQAENSDKKTIGLRNVAFQEEISQNLQS